MVRCTAATMQFGICTCVTRRKLRDPAARAHAGGCNKGSVAKFNLKPTSKPINIVQSVNYGPPNVTESQLCDSTFAS